MRNECMVYTIVMLREASEFITLIPDADILNYPVDIDVPWYFYGCFVHVCIHVHAI